MEKFKVVRYDTRTQICVTKTLNLIRERTDDDDYTEHEFLSYSPTSRRSSDPSECRTCRDAGATVARRRRKRAGKC